MSVVVVIAASQVTLVRIEAIEVVAVWRGKHRDLILLLAGRLVQGASV